MDLTMILLGGLLGLGFISVLAWLTLPKPSDDISKFEPQKKEPDTKAEVSPTVEKVVETITPPPIPKVEISVKVEEAVSPLPIKAKEISPQKDLGEALLKTKKGFIARIKGILTQEKQIDQNILQELEDILFTSDVGVKTSQKLIDTMQQELSRSQLSDTKKVLDTLKDSLESMVSIATPSFEKKENQPHIILMVGVNGVGKTTTIGKLAAQFREQGKIVVLGAGDTFRAAATEQLEIWGQRAGAFVVKGAENTDPASIAFNTIEKAMLDKADICIIDTAGRLHTKQNLMEELKKVKRVIQKMLPDAVPQTMLVMDSTIGQNGLIQAREFHQALKIDTITITKLDGTAKGGIVFGICDELKIPIQYIGVGESVNDLRPFEPKKFVDALFMN